MNDKLLLVIHAAGILHPYVIIIIASIIIVMLILNIEHSFVNNNFFME